MCKSLLEKNFRVIGLTRSEVTPESNLQKLGILRDLKVKRGDIKSFSDISNLIEKHQPESIFNLAAESSVGKSFIKPNESIESIVNGTINILNVCKSIKYPGRVFFAGSSEMFGNTAQAADATHPQDPISPYSIGKQASFNLVKLYRNAYDLKCVTGILFNHESHLRDKNFVTQKLVKGAFQIANKTKTNKIQLGNISIIRDWGWAPEFIEGIQVITNAEILNDYVICTGKPNTLEAFIDKLFSYFKLNWKEHIEIDKDLFRPNDIKISYGNPLPLFKDLGWKAKEDIDSIVNNMLTYEESSYKFNKS
tara:strand:- start:76 stop:999 length:924 start_codon:yes stop_codon:yes gene_type:complete